MLTSRMDRLHLLLCLLCFVLCLSGCQTHPPQSSYTVQHGRYTPGVYQACGQGNIGPVTVEVAFSADAIIRVDVIRHEETGVLSKPAIERIPAAIVDGQTLAVDVLSGATYTSQAIIDAVTICVEHAGGDADVLARDDMPSLQGETAVLDADVVVVGAGLSGMCAAVAAAQAGSRVIVMEKLAFIGGSATSSLGNFMICESDKPVQGQGTTVEDMLARWRAYTQIGSSDGQYPDYEHLEAILLLTEPTIQWLTDMGARFSPVGDVQPGTGNQLLQVDVSGKTENKPAGKLISLLADQAEKNGVILLTGVRATRLLADDSGITGVFGKSPQRAYRVSAGNVILACGGFSANTQRVARFMPVLEEGGYYNQGVSANVGDGMAMAEEIGAALYEDNWIIASFISPSEKLLKHNSRFLKLLEDNGLPDPDSSYDHMMVDQAGVRFMDESASYSQQNIAMVSHRTWPYYVLYDGVDEEIAEILRSGIETGDVFEGTTIEKLAQNAGMNPEILIRSVERYNEMALTGRDEDFGKDPTRMHPIAREGTYYLVRFVCCFTGTLGGVKTDEHFRVLRQDGTVIPGLYAVGEMANRQYYDRMYVSGSSLSFGAAMGMAAGTSAAHNRQ